MARGEPGGKDHRLTAIKKASKMVQSRDEEGVQQSRELKK
jgi:hypothetical protein